MTTALIVEDDDYQRFLLRQKITEHCSDLIEVIGEAYSAKNALKQIEALQPQLVFLDIELSAEDTGFDILEQVEDPTFGVIFVTAYATFAADAYLYDPISFLTKPVNEQRLRIAVERAVRLLRGDMILSPEDSVTTFTPPPRQPQQETILFKDGYKEFSVSSEHIMYCQAFGNYTEVQCFTETGVQKYTLRQTLGEVEEKLPRKEFLKVHRSFTINPIYIERVERDKRNYSIVLRTEENIPISRTYQFLLAERLHQFFR